MELENLKNFIVLTKYQNFGEAAEVLFISQSALSKRIKKLEEDMGVVLFNRTTKNVELNQYGEIFLKFAIEVVKLEKDCRLEIKKRLPTNKKVLNIGALPSFAEYEITELFSNFMKNTNIRINVNTAPSEKLELMLENGECDFAFIRQVHDANNHFIKTPIVSDKLMVVLPKNHALSQYKTIRIKQLKGEKFIMQPVNSRPYNHCLALCQKEGFEPDVIFTDSQIKNIIDFVEKGLGISLLMEKVIDDSLTKNVKAIAISPTVKSMVTLCSLRTKALQQPQKIFLSFVKKELLNK